MPRLIGFTAGCLVAAALAAPAPASPGSALEAGRTLFQQGEFDRARSRLQRFRKAHPDRAEPAFYLGRIALRRHNLEKAVSLLREASSLREGRARYHYWLGRANAERARHASVFKRAGYARRARAELQEALDRKPSHLPARVALVMYYLRAPDFLGGSLEKARQHIRELSRRSRLAALRARGALMKQQERYDRALAVYRQAVEEGPGRNRPYRWLAGLHRELENYERALSIYRERMSAASPDWEAFYGLARTALEAGRRLEEAEKALRRYLAHGPPPGAPSRSDARFLLGRILRQQGRSDEARVAFRKAMERAPNHPKAEEIRVSTRASIL